MLGALFTKDVWEMIIEFHVITNRVQSLIRLDASRQISYFWIRWQSSSGEPLLRRSTGTHGKMQVSKHFPPEKTQLSLGNPLGNGARM